MPMNYSNNKLDRTKKWIKLVDFLLVGFSFFMANYIKRGTFVLSNTYWNLLIAFYCFWIIVNYIEKKYQRLERVNFLGAIALSARTNLYILFLISFVTILMRLPGFSRMHVLSCCAILFVTESTLFGINNHKLRSQSSILITGGYRPALFKISWVRFFLDLFLLLLSFTIVNEIRRSSFHFSDDYLLIAYIITGLWFITSIFTQKFQKNGYQKNIWYYISPFIKSLILIIFGLSISLFLLKYYHLSRFELFSTLLIFGLLELTIFSTYYLIGKSESRNGDIESIEEIQKITKQKLLNIDENDQLDEYCVSPSLEYLLESDKRELYEFINSNIDVVNIPNNSLTVLDTRTDINIVNLKSESISLLINLHKLNDIRWINRYLLTLYEKVSIGGYIVGNLQTNEQYKEQFFCKMPSYLARVLFIPNFIFRRAIPKLPFFKQIYFSLTDGKNRALSKAEVFGRLHFCGYSVIAEKEINKHLWFISRKVKTISADQNPSYSPLIKLPRVGLNGNTIYLYKIRTMHPYSEYLQEYIYKNNLLDEKGKIKNDFRVTGWGKLLRKLWIDELPQIINWWRGDVSLVGVRALSHHFFDLYPEDMQKLRVQFKPGLVPPYYADMPRTFDEIVESERNYLLRKKEKPFTTDVIYFFKAFYNILFKHARSR